MGSACKKGAHSTRATAHTPKVPWAGWVRPSDADKTRGLRRRVSCGRGRGAEGKGAGHLGGAKRGAGVKGGGRLGGGLRGRGSKKRGRGAEGGNRGADIRLSTGTHPFQLPRVHSDALTVALCTVPHAATPEQGSMAQPKGRCAHSRRLTGPSALFFGLAQPSRHGILYFLQAHAAVR